MRKILILGVAMTLLVAACGSDDDETPSATATEGVDDGADTGADEIEPEESDLDEAEVEESAEEVEQEPTTTTEPPTTTAAPTTTTEPPAEDAAPAGGGFTMYDFRYCEIIMTVTDDAGDEVTEVWGTPGVDPCTDEAWYALDPAAIQAENDASFIEMNGPRYFVVDGTVDTGDGTGGAGIASGGEAVPRQFGDITMNLLATTVVSEESEIYVPDLVDRTTTWTYQAGTEIYELTDPDGNVYIMQSYSRIVDEDLTAADLPTLGDRLDLPDGWSYSSRILDEPLQVALSPDGALVVGDDFRNSYQRNG